MHGNPSIYHIQQCSLTYIKLIWHVLDHEVIGQNIKKGKFGYNCQSFRINWFILSFISDYFGVMQIDKVLETHVGSFGRYQKLLVALLSIPGFISCIFTMEILFTAGKMDYWCDIPQPQEGPLSNLTRDDWLAIAIPTKYEEGKPKRDKCTAYHINVSYIGVSDSLQNTSTSQCSKYEYDTSVFKTTIVNEVSRQQRHNALI